MKMNLKTAAACALFVIMLVGFFLPWYAGESLSRMILFGLGVGVSLNSQHWIDLGPIVILLFAAFGIAAVASLLFALRAAVTSFHGKIKGLTPAGTLMSVLALGVLAIAMLLDSIADAQIGLWLCLTAGLIETVWGIFN